MLFSFFYLFFKMVAWHAMRQKCHISNAKWIIAPTQLNQMPPSDSRPPSRGGLVNLHQAWFVAIGFSRNLAHFLIKTSFFDAPLWVMLKNPNFSKEQINVKSSRRSRLSHLFISFFSPIHSSRWAALRPAALSLTRFKSKTNLETTPRLNSLQLISTLAFLLQFAHFTRGLMTHSFILLLPHEGWSPLEYNPPLGSPSQSNNTV